MKQASRFNINKGWKILITDMGMNPADVLKLANLPLDLFTRNDASISVDEYLDLWHGMEKIAGKEQLPLKIGQAISVEIFDPPIFASLCSPNLNIALQRLSKYKRLICPIILKLDINDYSTSVSISICGYEDKIPFSIGASDMVFFTKLARIATRQNIVPLRVTLTELPENRQEYDKYFGVAVEKGLINSILFSNKDALRPFLTEDAGMWNYFEADLNQKLIDLDTRATSADCVRSILLEMLPSGLSSMEEAAKRLAISKRTLQRRLTDENTSFQFVLQQTREQLARHYLSNPELSQGEISFLLGFQDTNSFVRAFNSWTGISPGQHRTNLH